jgi:hypothetical protein
MGINLQFQSTPAPPASLFALAAVVTAAMVPWP